MMFDVLFPIVFTLIKFLTSMSEHFHQFVTISVKALVLHICDVIVAMKQINPIERLTSLFQGYE